MLINVVGMKGLSSLVKLEALLHYTLVFFKYSTCTSPIVLLYDFSLMCYFFIDAIERLNNCKLHRYTNSTSTATE